MVRVALLSNPKSTGNRQTLPRVRSYCASNPDIFHYEVEHVDQIGRALQTIARVDPVVIVINGGDGTVQAALTELYQGEHFQGRVPPIAVLPNGKTNLIALDLGIHGDPIKALERIVQIAKAGVDDHVVARELIALSDGQAESRPVLGMFLGGAGLADYMLYCRNQIYPLGLSNGISHFLTVIAVLVSLVFGVRARFLPQSSRPVRISLIRDGQLAGRFAVLIVTTLERLLLGVQPGDSRRGNMKLMAVDQNLAALLRLFWASVTRRVGKAQMQGIHLEQGDVIRIEGDHSSVILDGELFEASEGKPIVLRSTEPVPFLRLAA
ncbi:MULTISPECIES: diacylglycerol/lipid kinase family protein [Sphingobium]|uniref:Diacylglycerol kinase n=1 Tax=Sphingobium chungbukense TaxID=56193 RepID=A0A0M3AS05_9SPHN|nr:MULTISPECIES: diacylglycerol kinase family protein [Sphingobium]KKW91304.1 diacylglycerol kinase [Sphingobium chungbukense]PJG47613.1 diacylglycerol kinase [Sphingobium sp. LB126]